MGVRQERPVCKEASTSFLCKSATGLQLILEAHLQALVLLVCFLVGRVLPVPLLSVTGTWVVLSKYLLGGQVVERKVGG